MSDTVKLIIEIPKTEYELIFGSEDCGLHTLTRAIAHGVLLDDVIAKFEEHKYSREYCIEHGIDWAIDMGMVRIILNNIGKESEGV